jgi:hypothetical protein
MKNHSTPTHDTTASIHWNGFGPTNMPKNIMTIVTTAAPANPRETAAGGCGPVTDCDCTHPIATFVFGRVSTHARKEQVKFKAHQ